MKTSNAEHRTPRIQRAPQPTSIGCWLLVVGCWMFPLLLSLPSPALAASSIVSVNYGNLISRADLHYASAMDSSEAGMPIGNGRMGSLVWTTPNAIRLQINRVDVFPTDCATDSFPERNTDYTGGCGFVDIAFPEFNAETFPANQTTQHLYCYDGFGTVEGAGVRAEILAWHSDDVMAIRITDRRSNPGTIAINLRMLRAPTVRTASHTARSELESRDGRMLLTQRFTEGDHVCSSALGVSVVGREAQVRESNDRELQLLAKPGNGSFTVLIASAASMSRDGDMAASALARLQQAESQGFDALAASNREWWHAFWERSFIDLHSEDGAADTVEQLYNYYLYIMAASSRGSLPAKFNGMIWTTEGDRRQWGALYWGANQSCLYNNALYAANQFELIDPMLDMVSGMLDACGVAAEQQWGSKGVFIPETVAFDGLAPLPDTIAAEMRDLYLVRKPWDEHSEEFVEYARTKQPHSSRWNWNGGGRWINGRWMPSERGTGPFGPVTHIFSRGAKYAYQFWVRYEYTRDEQWLRDRAYPILKGVAEFYRNFPNVKKGADGKYHIHHVNSNESVQGAQDTDEEIASMMGILPVVIRASEILNVDAEMRPVWKEFLANLAPLPRSDHPDAAPSRMTNATPIWIRGLPPVVRGSTSGRPDGNTMPQWFFDLCTLESDPEVFKIGDATLGPVSRRRVGVLSKIPLVAAIMGRADGVRELLPTQYTTSDRADPMANRLDMREGAQTTSAQRLGNASDALHTALCYDLPAGPGQPPVIRVFAAWPKEWDAAFTLLARGGFLVTSAMQKGEIDFVELESQFGGECRLRNPWGEGELTLHRDGRAAETLRGSLLKFDTRKGETVIVTRPGVTLDGLRAKVPNFPVSR